MPETSKEFLKWQSEAMEKKLPAWNEIPDIGLYMDQVMRLMEDYLRFFGEDEKGGASITPSMINNYVKMGLVPPPDNKKYDRSQIATLILVCILKQVLSISDVGAMLGSKLAVMDMEECYNEFRDVLNTAASELSDLTGGFDRYIESGDLVNVAMTVAVFSNVGRAIAKKIIALESAAEAAAEAKKKPAKKRKGEKEEEK